LVVAGPPEAALRGDGRPAPARPALGLFAEASPRWRAARAADDRLPDHPLPRRVLPRRRRRALRRPGRLAIHPHRTLPRRPPALAPPAEADGRPWPPRRRAPAPAVAPRRGPIDLEATATTTVTTSTVLVIARAPRVGWPGPARRLALPRPPHRP